MNVTKDQIKEVLQRFRYFGYSMYYTKEGGELFKNENRNNPLEHNGKKFYVSVEESGQFRLQYTDSDVFALVRVINLTSPPKSESLIDNLGYASEIENREELSEEDFKFFNEVSIFCGSFFQRLQFFTFLSRMADITLDRYADSLLRMERI